MAQRVGLWVLVMLGLVAVLGRPRVEMAAQVNSQAPPLIDLPPAQQAGPGGMPRGGELPRGGIGSGSVKAQSPRCYAKQPSKRPKGCIYPERHDVGEMCVCSLDGGEVPGVFME